jgi:hypothetical protein
MVNRKTADDGITKSKQLKCMFHVQFHAYSIICLKVSFKSSKDDILSKKYLTPDDSGAIIVVCIAALSLFISPELHYARFTIYVIMESLSQAMGSGIIFVQTSAPVFCG